MIKKSFCLQLGCWFIIFACCLPSVQSVDAQDFDKQIAPLLAARCLECHSGHEVEGELNLSSFKTALQGGESGKVIVPGNPEKSLLWQHIRDDEMPPEKPLLAKEKALLKKWIASGAKWGSDPIDRFKYTSDVRAGYDWWSLQPIVRPQLPKSKNNQWPRNEIDHFILAKLIAKGLKPSPEVDRATYIRRISFDLLGLPPTPLQVKTFLEDKDPKAYEKLVDRLLASKHYGEHWARHWLDLARFGESNGFEYDRPRPNSWPYRDWVISALNQDMPYNEFSRLQIAGDLLKPNDADAITATGFLIGGAFDDLKPAGNKMRVIMRQDELSDLVGVVGQTFLGMTVQCSRCHDHKFDPILQKDYYRMASALSGVHRGNRNIRYGGNEKEINIQIAAVRKQIDAIQQPVRKLIATKKQKSNKKGEKIKDDSKAPTPISRWTFNKDLKDSIGQLHGKAHGAVKIQNGRLVLNGKDAFVSTVPLKTNLNEKTMAVWLELNTLDQAGGGAISIQTTNGATFDSVVFGEREPGKWMAGSDFYRRYKSFAGSSEATEKKTVVAIVIVYQSDGTITAYRNGKPYGTAYKSVLQRFQAGKAQILFGLRHGSSAGAGRILAAKIDRAELFDHALSAKEVASLSNLAIVTQAEVLAALTKKQRSKIEQLNKELLSLQSILKPAKSMPVFSVTPRAAPEVRILNRGNPFQPTELVSAGGIAKVYSAAADFGLKPNAAEADRRKKLAAWITDDKNPLFSRTIVNRLWHYHFGAGLIKTPNDLGFNGSQPSHPQLLDWMASELVAKKWSLKALHKKIILSATYRQSSQPRSDVIKVDAENRLLWRKSLARLEAESVRDSILFVAGKLNPARGGPGFEDYRKYHHKGIWIYEPADHVGPLQNRRSIYRTWARGGRNPMLDTFDCPDPSTPTPSRGVTTTPLQALVLLNNAFVLRMSDHFAKRLETEAGKEIDKQIKLAYQIAFCREVHQTEMNRNREFIKKHGMPAFCRVLFNTNEFIYVK